jgi:hypothetical protein
MELILPVALNGCETWSLTLTDDYRLRVFESRVLKRIFGPKREEVAGGCGSLHNEVLHNLYASPNTPITVIKSRMRWTGHVARMGDMRNASNVLVGNPKEKTRKT